MFSAPAIRIGQVFAGLSAKFRENENKFHKFTSLDVKFVDHGKNMAQYEKINYMLCLGRSAT